MSTVGLGRLFGVASVIGLFAATEVTAQVNSPRERAIATASMFRTCMTMTAANAHYVNVPVSARAAYCRCVAPRVGAAVPLAVLKGPETAEYDGVVETAAKACYRPLVPYLKD